LNNGSVPCISCELSIKFFLACVRRANQAKENEEKLVTLKEREEHQNKGAEKKRKDADMRQAEERRRKEEEERKAKAEENAARFRYTQRDSMETLKRSVSRDISGLFLHVWTDLSLNIQGPLLVFTFLRCPFDFILK